MPSEEEFEKFQRNIMGGGAAGKGDTADHRIAELESEVERQKLRRNQEKSVMEAEMQRMRATLAEVQSRAVRGAEAPSNETQNHATIARALSSIEGALAHLFTTMRNTQENFGRSNQSIIADPSSLIREFNGGEPPEQSRAWLRELENVVTLYEWTSAVAFSVAKSRLRGAAIKWLMSKAEQLTDFDTFISVFTSIFFQFRSMTDRLRAMSAQVQTNRESVQE